MTKKPEHKALNPCPFCGDEDIRFSMKVANRRTGNDYVLWHAAMYCNDCNSYGKRVLCRSTEKYRPSAIEKTNFENYAALAWNTRANTVNDELVDMLGLAYEYISVNSFAGCPNAAALQGAIANTLAKARGEA